MPTGCTVAIPAEEEFCTLGREKTKSELGGKLNENQCWNLWAHALQSPGCQPYSEQDDVSLASPPVLMLLGEESLQRGRLL